MTRQSCGSGCVLERDERENHGKQPEHRPDGGHQYRLRRGKPAPRVKTSALRPLRRASSTARTIGGNLSSSPCGIAARTVEPRLTAGLPDTPATYPDRALRINERPERATLRSHKGARGSFGRQPQREDAAAPRTRRVSERAPLQRRQAARDRQPEARPAPSHVGGGARRTVERLEDALLLAGGDAGATVGYGEHQRGTVAVHRQLDRRGGRCVVRGVAQQIAQDPERLDEIEPSTRAGSVKSILVSTGRSFRNPAVCRTAAPTRSS